MIMSLSACIDHEHKRNANQTPDEVPAPSGGGSGGADTVAPRIIATVPPRNARGAVLSGPVAVVTFSEPLASATVNVNSFTLTGPAGRVDGDVVLQGTQALFTPRLPLIVGGDYTASLSVAIRDPAGNPLPAAYEWQFNTGGNRLAAGARHTCLRADSGTIKCWGDNTYGQLGVGDTQVRGDQAGELGDNLPVVVLGRRRWKWWQAITIAAPGWMTARSNAGGSIGSANSASAMMKPRAMRRAKCRICPR